MITDTSILKSLNDYISRRIQEIPLEIKETFLETQKVWKCENELDFLYGYYVGKIEEATLHYLLKATRASAGGYVDTFENRGIIEEHRDTLQNAINTGLQ